MPEPEVFAFEEQEHQDVWRSAWQAWGQHPREAPETTEIIAQHHTWLVTFARSLENFRNIVLTMENKGLEESSTSFAAIIAGLANEGYLSHSTWRKSEVYKLRKRLDSISELFLAHKAILLYGAPETAAPLEETPKGQCEKAVRLFGIETKDIPAVEGVYCTEVGDVVHVWTLLDEYNREAEDQIYAAEAKTLDAFPGVRLSFRILYRHGKSLDEVRPAEAQLVV